MSSTLWSTIWNHCTIIILFARCYSNCDLASQSIAWDVSWREMQDNACFFLRISLSKERDKMKHTPIVIEPNSYHRIIKGNSIHSNPFAPLMRPIFTVNNQYLKIYVSSILITNQVIFLDIRIEYLEYIAFTIRSICNIKCWLYQR